MPIASPERADPPGDRLCRGGVEAGEGDIHAGGAGARMWSSSRGRGRLWPGEQLEICSVRAKPSKNMSRGSHYKRGAGVSLGGGGSAERVADARSRRRDLMRTLVTGIVGGVGGGSPYASSEASAGGGGGGVIAQRSSLWTRRSRGNNVYGCVQPLPVATGSS